jgi:hypothetical protein
MRNAVAQTGADRVPLTSAEVLAGEFAAVHHALPLDARLRAAASEADVRAAHFEVGTTALCLSGGGIRSASFCLGVVQGLARRGLLARFDYLSTVSGGGYLGSMLAAWMYRTPGGAADVEAALRTDAPHAGDALDTLRRYVRYLAPRQGFFSVDTWTLVATYVRNFVLNALIWLPLLALVLMLPLLAAALVDWVNAALESPTPLRAAALAGSAISLLTMLASTFVLRKAISGREIHAANAAAPGATAAPPQAPATAAEGSAINRHVQQALCSGGLLLSAATYWLAFAEPDALWSALAELANRYLPWLPVSAATPPPVVLGLLFVVPHAYLGLAYRSPQLVRLSHRAAVTVAGGFVGFVTGCLIGWIMTALAHSGAWALTLEGYVTVAPPAFLGAVALGEILFAGAISRFSTDFDREWWARAGASATILCIAWVALCALAFFGPVALDWLLDLAAGVPLYTVTVGLAGVIVRVLLQQENAVGRDGQPRPRMRALERAIDVVAGVALAAILCGIAWLVTVAVTDLAAFTGRVGARMAALELLYAVSDVLLVAIVLGVVLVLAGVCVDVNRFSLHGMYRDRLIRTFLGSTRGRYPPPPWPPDDTERYAESHQFEPRNPDEFIQFDRDDNPMLRWLAPGRAGAPRRGPFLIVNAALNLVSGRNLAWQERKAASFTFTPLSVGSPLLGYRSSADYAADAGGITLGTAMAVSGAAVSPNAGALSSPLRTFLLALYNARLGWWLGHPADPGRVRRTGPAFAVYPLVSELLGRTDERHPWLFVSDGGHFENLGLYEAVRRGCRDIVVVDASCDPDRNYDDLGNAIRKIRIDLGVRIERAGPLRIGPPDLRAEGRYCALFDVIYDDTRSGSLLYIKSAVYPKAENMPIDVLQYAGRSETFPHESTARQFFTESQFESYRALGEFEVDAIVEGVEMANRPDRTIPVSVAEFIEIAAIRMTE